MGESIRGWRWIKVDRDTPLPMGRVESVTCRQYPLCFSRYGLLKDFTRLPCPHQQIHKGAATLDQGWLHCPWHGWELLPLAKSESLDGPPFRVEFRHDGVFIGLPVPPPDPLLLLPPSEPSDL